MNIYEMYVEHWKRPGFWVRRTTWGNTIAKIKEVGELVGRAPYYGNPQVVAVVFDLHTGELKDEYFVIDTAGTYKTWRWVNPPSWSGEPDFDPKAGRAILNVPYAENRRASSIGARWSALLGAWWIAETDEKALAKAKDRGYMEPIPHRIYFSGTFEQRLTAKDSGAKWESRKQLWSLPTTETEAIDKLRIAGFQEVDPT
ncbi:hypothetical protein E8E95_04540 [Pseudomonas sp. BN414]|uniref:hypothetical protein n=1 Tax=Pseudomonas sp. BN414 TaxID=2567888 RepID=UPI002456551B|nr:hypothetical protein [Pseudomonas sp. BN414]MDH4565939.1 hypothetical protein [Pseudomonas sp. BN414]